MRIPWAFEFFPVEPPATRVHCTTAKLVVGSRPPPRAATEVPNESDTGERTPAAEAAAQGAEATIAERSKTGSYGKEGETMIVVRRTRSI
jgi:hypothetical protein